MADASPIASVRLILTRHEGPVQWVDRPRAFETFEDAQAQLALWSLDAPEGGGYDKCSVRLIIASGPADGTRGPVETYDATFRLDLTRAGVRDLRAWLEEAAGYYAGQYEPPEETAPQYAALRAAWIRSPDSLAYVIACGALWSRLRILAREAKRP